MSKVAIVPCTSYDQDEVYMAINKGITLLGGLQTILDGAQNVLIKAKFSDSGRSQTRRNNSSGFF